MILCIDGACSLLTACLFYVAAKDLTRLKSHRCVRVSLLNNTELKINVTANGSIQRMMLSTPQGNMSNISKAFRGRMGMMNNCISSPGERVITSTPIKFNSLRFSHALFSFPSFTTCDSMTCLMISSWEFQRLSTDSHFETQA